MTVEVRVIPAGVSGLSKKKTQSQQKPKAVRLNPKETAKLKQKTKEKIVPIVGRYGEAVTRTVTRMQSENKAEHNRLTDREIHRQLRQQLSTAHPQKSGVEIDILVNQVLPTVMAAYRGPAAQPAPVRSAEEVAVWTARNTERRRVVKSNRLRRKADQPMSKADRAWVASGRR
jgi:hypothetical protein